MASNGVPANANVDKVMSLFRTFDADRNGAIDKTDFVKILHTLDPTNTAERCASMFAALNDNEDGRIHFDDFMRWVFSPDGEVVRDAFGDMQFRPPVTGSDSGYFTVVSQWASEYPGAATRLVLEDLDEHCLHLEMWGAKLQVYLPFDSEDSFFVTTAEWSDELGAVLTDLNAAPVSELTELLTCANILFEESLRLRAESLSVARQESGAAGSATQDVESLCVAPSLQVSPLLREQSAIGSTFDDARRSLYEGVQRVCNAARPCLNSSASTEWNEEDLRSATILMLLQAEWDEEYVINRIGSSGIDEALTVAGVIPAGGQPPEILPEMCCVCFCDPAQPTLACGHGLCAECWPGFLKCNLNSGTVDGQNCLRLRCPGERCSLFVPPKIFEGFLESADIQRYKQLLAVSFVRHSPLVAKCPALGCEMFVTGSKRKSTVLCKCGHYFCFTCGENAHEPLPCAQAVSWGRLLEKAKDGDLQVPKRNETIKNCPNGKCGVPIFKDRGCMYMSCSQCNEHWCWMCGHWGGGPSGRPQPHHVGSCNDPANQLWGFVDGFDFYQQRFQSHLGALEFCQKLRDIVPATGIAIGLADADFKLVCQAVEYLVEYRQILAWSYAWRYFENDKDRMDGYQDAQLSLERRVERLSEMIEGDPQKPHCSWIWMNFGLTQEFSTLVNDLWGQAPDASFQLADLFAEMREDVDRLKAFGPPSAPEEPVEPARPLRRVGGRGRGRPRAKVGAAARPQRPARAPRRI